MKLNTIAPLLLSLLATPAFAHPVHDDDEQIPQMMRGVQGAAPARVAEPATPPETAPKPKAKAAQDKKRKPVPKTSTAAAPTAAPGQ